MTYRVKLNTGFRAASSDVRSNS
ncbi:hypothetical protein VTL71DRAFT_15006 [Oculimacula yallundae]|uniref:Uncharacterized protein n=1 Tax=Oculimacula yallundae TaxID=86028 RepID=A0ABR4CFG3_9HELO